VSNYNLQKFTTKSISHTHCCRRNLFGDAIFDLIDTEDTANIEFGEFVQGVCTFAMFQVVDVLRFSFFIFDKDKNGEESEASEPFGRRAYEKASEAS